MKEPDFPDNEAQRIKDLHSLDILDTEPEERFDRVTRIAKHLFDVPIAVVSLVDNHRQWFKSCIGLPVRETARNVSFCGHVINDEALSLLMMPPKIRVFLIIRLLWASLLFGFMQASLWSITTRVSSARYVSLIRNRVS
ncbi:hypothetical protein N779_20675 [Vibrio coralliilyticus OCN008]|nr:hypothetical protein N779_20675 [Vibrio coralliilyticus OCN008]